MSRKGICFFICVSLSAFLNAKPNFKMDWGRISCVGVFGKNDISVAPVMEIPDLYVIGESGFFASICPFTIEFKWDPSHIANLEKGQPWDLVNVSFFNCNIGWMTDLGKDFLFESYIQFNGLCIADINKISFTPMLEFSLVPSLLNDCVNGNKDIYIPKLLSLRTGISFFNTDNYRPSIYVSLGFDVVAYINLIDCL